MGGGGKLTVEPRMFSFVALLSAGVFLGIESPDSVSSATSASQSVRVIGEVLWGLAALEAAFRPAKPRSVSSSVYMEHFNFPPPGTALPICSEHHTVDSRANAQQCGAIIRGNLARLGSPCQRQGQGY